MYPEGTCHPLFSKSGKEVRGKECGEDEKRRTSFMSGSRFASGGRQCPSWG